MRATVAVILLALGSIAIIVASEPSRPSAPQAIHLRTEPPVPKKGENLMVHVGMKIKVRVEVTFADGSRRDVGEDPAIIMVSTDETTATVSRSGEVVFLSTSGMAIGSVGIIVTYGEVGEILNFSVVAESVQDR